MARESDCCPEDAATFLRWDMLGTACCRVCMEPLHETADGECIACLDLADRLERDDAEWDCDRRFDGEE